MAAPELEDVLFQWAGAQPTITQYIGAAPLEVRFYKLKAPQKSKTPHIIQQRSGGTQDQVYCGPDGAVRIQLQVDHYAMTWAEMAGLAKAFRRALNPNPSPYPAYLGSGNSPGVQLRVKSAVCDNEFDSDDSDPGLFRRTQFWSFWVFEP